MNTHSPIVWRRYLALLGGMSLTSLAAVASLNYVVDPYLIHQWDTPRLQRMMPGREKLSPWSKAYAVAALKPQVLYVGNSRTEVGLSAQAAQFSGKTVFNAALSGATLGDTIAMVRHAQVVSKLDTVVWGLDAPSFSLEEGNTDFDRELVARDWLYPARRSLVYLKRALTVDMTLDTLRMLLGSYGGICQSSLLFGGRRDERCLRDRIDRLGGAAAVIQARVEDFVRGAGPTKEAMPALETAIDDLCLAQVRIRLYINPTHAMTADALFWSGRWAAMEAWESQLTRVVQRRRDRGCDVRLFDFSGFNTVTTEPIPQACGQRDMRYYWEPSHYRASIGQMILARMFPRDQPLVKDFGVELTPASLAAHQAEQREGRERFHHDHPLETEVARRTAQPFSQMRSD